MAVEVNSGPPREPRRRSGAVIIAILAAVALGGAAFRLLPGTPAGRAWIAERVSGVKVGRLGWLRVEGLVGDPWSHLSAKRVTIADRAGVWLEARDVAVSWRPAELLAGRVHLTSLEAGRIAILRRFTLAAAGPPKRSPVSVRIDRFTSRLETAPAFSINRGVFDVGGALAIGRSGSPTGVLHGVSVSRPGDRADARFDFSRRGRFVVAVAAAEARGGALGGALGLAVDRDFRLEIRGQGRGRDGAFALTATSGGRMAAEAGGRWSAAGGAARARIVLAASTLLAPYAAMLGPEARLSVDGRRAGGDLYDLTTVVAADNIDFKATGRIDARRTATGPRGLAIILNVPQPARLAAFGAAGPGRLRAGLGGDVRRWALAGEADLERPSTRALALARLGVTFRLRGGDGRIDLATSLRGEGAVAGAGLPGALLGARPDASAEVEWLGDRRMIIRQIKLDGAHVQVRGQGQQGPFGDLAFSGSGVFDSLAAAGTGLQGGVEVGWQARQAGLRPWSFDLDARGRRLATGVGQLDHLLGRTPRLRARGTYGRGLLKLEEAALDGAGGQVTAAGAVGPRQALSLALGWRASGPFSLGPLEITGAAKGTGDVVGTVASPKADLVADFSVIDLPSLPLRGAHLIVSLGRIAGGPAGRLALTAASPQGPASAAAAFDVGAGGLSVTDMHAAAGGATLAGSFLLRDGEPSSADLIFAAGPGAFLARGRVAGRARIVEAAGGPTADMVVTGSDLSLASGASFKTLRLSAVGPLRRLPYKAEGAGAWLGAAWRASGSGLYSQSAGGREVTFAGVGRMGGIDLKTTAPAKVDFVGGGYRASAELGIGSGRAALTFADTGGAPRGRGVVSGLGLAVFDPDLSGRLDGELNLRGDGGLLGGDLKARVTGLGPRGGKGGPVIDGVVTGALARDSLTIAGDFGGGKGSAAHVTLALPVETSVAPLRLAVASHRPMAGRFDIDGELAALWDLTMGDGQSLGGRLVAAGALGGSLADPRVTGTAALDAGRFQDLSTGLKLEAVTVRAALSDNAIDISRFEGRDGARGSVSGAGRVGLERNGSSSFRLDLKGFRLIDNEIGQVASSGQITVNRAADGKVKLAGTLVIDRAQIAPRPPSPSGVVPMEVVEIHRRGDPAADEPAPGRPREAPVDLDVALKAPGGVFIRGRGLNIELSLDARVSGTTTAPVLSGAARVVRGDYDFAGKRFSLDESGVVRLASTPEAIRLDLTATREDPTLTAVIRITGTAAKPIITLTSTPALPKDEVLSQVLFGASASSLNGLEAAQLASALSGLASGGGFDVIGGLRNLAHLDRLAFSGGGAAGTSVAGGKYLTDKVYLELSGGAREGPGAQVEWRVKKHLAIVSRVTSQGDQQISVRWRKDY